MKNPSKIRNVFRLALTTAVVIFSFAALCREAKDVYFSKPEYFKRTTQPWAKLTRLVGELKNPPPQFTIDIYSHSTGQIIRTETHSGSLSVFQTGWLSPGTYTFTFNAEGYEPSPLKSLKVEANSDCFIKVEFGKIAYKKSN
jgi:hypothetical protein